jgi:hypothetical protein
LQILRIAGTQLSPNTPNVHQKGTNYLFIFILIPLYIAQPSQDVPFHGLPSPLREGCICATIYFTLVIDFEPLHSLSFFYLICIVKQVGDLLRDNLPYYYVA